MQRAHPDFETQFVVIGLSTQNLTGLVRQRSCNKTSDRVQWTDREASKCELLLTGLQPHKNNRKAIYAVTSAHLLLYDKEMLDLEDADDFQQQELKLEYSRNEVNKRIGENVYVFETHGDLQSIDLCNPPLLGFRTCRHSSDQSRENAKASVPGPYDYMSDIAIIPVEQSNSQFVDALVQSPEIHLISKIRHLSESFLEEFISKKSKLYAKGRECAAVLPWREVYDTPKKTRAICLSFRITKG